MDEQLNPDGAQPLDEGDPVEPADSEAIEVTTTSEFEPEAVSELPSAEDAQKEAAENPGYGVPASDGKTYWGVSA